MAKLGRHRPTKGDVARIEVVVMPTNSGSASKHNLRLPATVVVALVLLAGSCGPDSKPASEGTTPTAAGTKATVSTSGGDISALESLIRDVVDGPHQIVESPDALADLLVPYGALPADLTVGEISISPVLADESSLSSSEDGGRTAVYRLEPAGATFQIPLLVRLKRPLSPDSAIPTIYLLSGSEPTPLDIAVEADEPNESLTIYAPVPHFSALVVDEGESVENLVSGAFGLFRLTMTDAGDRLVGQGFTLEAKTQVNRTDNTTSHAITFRGDSSPTKFSRSRIVNSWKLQGTWQALGAVTPELVPEAPPYTLVGGDTFTARQAFTCAKSGSSEVGYSATVAVIMTDRITNLDTGRVNDLERFAIAYLDTKTPEFRCIVDRPTVGPVTPTPTGLVTPMSLLPKHPPLLWQGTRLFPVVKGPFTLTLTGPEGSKLVGESFPVTAKVELDRTGPWSFETRYRAWDGMRTNTARQVESWSLSGSWSAASPVVSPSAVDAPVSERPTGDSITTALTFTCVQPGEVWVSFKASIRSTKTWEMWQSENDTGRLKDTRLEDEILNAGPLPFQCVAPSSATPTASSTTPRNRPPVVSPIQGEYESGNITRYSVIVSDPDGDFLTALWEGRDCGAPQTFGPKTDKLGAQGRFEMVWAHTAAYCHRETFKTPEPNPDHANTVIKVTISDAGSVADAILRKFLWQVTCTYNGAADGTGLACSAPVNIAK